MKAPDVRAKTDDELKTELGQLAKEVFNLRFQKASGQMENTAQHAAGAARRGRGSRPCSPKRARPSKQKRAG